MDEKYFKLLEEAYETFEDTSQIPLPKDPLLEVIGQEKAITVAKAIAKQRRHLLLVGPPGIGKSMVAKAVSSLLGAPQHQVSVVHNEKKPERPLVKVEHHSMLKETKEPSDSQGELLLPSEVPVFVAEELGYRCKRCGELSNPYVEYCTGCNSRKSKGAFNPFEDLIMPTNIAATKKKTVKTTRINADGKKENVIYEEAGDFIRVVSERDVRRRGSKLRKKVIVPIKRSLFVRVNGASETELLGDVQHDPYGGHPEIGIPPYMRVVAGAVHEAHEGVLFVDELATFSFELQKSILTAMQEKKFSITGRNSSSTGATIKVDDVPCDFILVGAINVSDVQMLSPALRSRIRGDGYEVLLKHYMEDNEFNRARIAQFAAQEIRRDGKIPHASREAVSRIIGAAKNIAKKVDGKNALTLRLRNLSGVIKMAGDIAVLEGSPVIEPKHVEEALGTAKTIEEQLGETYENWWNASMADSGASSKKGSGVF